MTPVVYVILYIVGAGGTTALLYRLLPRRWSDSTRIIVAHLAVYLLSCGLFATKPSGFDALGMDYPTSLAVLLLIPQQVVVLLSIVRSEERRLAETSGPDTVEPAATSRDDTDRVGPLRPPDRKSNSGNRNPFRRFWSGDYALGPAFWGIAAIGSSLIALPSALVQNYLEFDPSIDEVTYQIAEVAGFGFYALLEIVLLIGVLRSARRRVKERHAIGRRAVWARVAQVYVGILLLFAVFNIGIVGFLAYTDISINRDRSIPDYTLRVMRDATEMEVTGGFRPGLARDVARVLRDNTAVRIVHLDSPGGQAREGERLFLLFRRKLLDTYAADLCASACTLAFVGGAERWVGRDARIGFHTGSIDHVGETLKNFSGPVAGVNMRGVYKKAGIDPLFIDKALATPNDSLLIPKPWELLAAKVATRVAGDGRFAVSGLGSDPASADFLMATSRMFPILHPIAGGWDDDYDNLLNDIIDGWRSGLTRDELTALVDDRTAELAATELADTDAATITQVVRLWADTFATLATSDPSRCRILAAGRKNAVSRLPASDVLADRRGALVRHLIDDHTMDFQGMETERYERGRKAFVAAVRRDLGDDVANRLSKPPAEVDAALLCATWKSVLERVPSWDREIGLAVAWRFGL